MDKKLKAEAKRAKRLDRKQRKEEALLNPPTEVDPDAEDDTEEAAAEDNG